MPYKAGLPVNFVFRVYDIYLNTPLLGLTPAEVTSFLFLDGVVPGVVPTITLTEISDGFYSVAFTPNSVGWWSIAVQHDVWGITIFSENFKCLASNIEDVAILVPTGTVPVTIIVEDPTPTPVEGVSLAIWNNGHTLLLGHVETDISGEASFTIPPGDYEIWPYKPMYDFPGTPFAFTAVLATPLTINITAQPQFIRRPTRPDRCVVWGYVVDIRGVAVKGATVEALREDSAITTPQGDGLGNKVARTHTNQQGYFELELIRGQLTTVRIPQQNHEKKFVVPDQSNIDFFSITQLSPP